MLSWCTVHVCVAQVLFSGIATPQVIRELVDWAAHQGGTLTVNVPRKPGQMGGICSFVELGHGYGLLLNDMIDEYLVNMYGMAAGGMTPGTWTAAECWSPGGGSSGYATPSQTLLPTLLKWQVRPVIPPSLLACRCNVVAMSLHCRICVSSLVACIHLICCRVQLLFEDPFAETLWLARAIPRSWLTLGKNVSLSRSPSSYGRLGFTLVASIPGVIKASIILPPSFKWPPGGVQLRLRSPDYPAKKIATVTVGGKPWTGFNATVETVRFGATFPGAAALLNIVATFA
jgi:hypothetical protein